VTAKPETPHMRNLGIKRFLTTVRTECANHLKSVFDLTPDERKVVLLVTALFILGLVIRLVRSGSLCHD
jgi:hypothetical protein